MTLGMAQLRLMSHVTVSLSVHNAFLLYLVNKNVLNEPRGIGLYVKMSFFIVGF